MVTTQPQAIAGVSAGYENVIETVYPSIAAWGLGRLLGRSRWIVYCPLTWPISATLYFLQKVFGNYYTVTNYSVQVRKAMGIRLLKQVSLSEIAEIAIETTDGQAAYRAGNLYLLNSAGDTLLRLDGVPYPDRFRQVILDARAARLQSDAALASIRNRRSA